MRGPTCRVATGWIGRDQLAPVLVQSISERAITPAYTELCRVVEAFSSTVSPSEFKSSNYSHYQSRDKHSRLRPQLVQVVSR